MGGRNNISHTTHKQKVYEKRQLHEDKEAKYTFLTNNVNELAREKFRRPPYYVGTRKKHTPL